MSAARAQRVGGERVENVARRRVLPQILADGGLLPRSISGVYYLQIESASPGYANSQFPLSRRRIRLAGF
jgi:hypothetical protein